MEGFQAKLKYYNAQADKELSKYPQIIKLEQQVGVPKTYLAAGVVGFVSFLIFFDVWGQLLSNLIGWLYPAYTSFKAIESTEKSDDTQWLTYWLFLPPFKGAQVLYAKFLRPFLIAYQGDVDSSLNKLKSKVNEATKEAMNSVVDSVSSDRSDKTE
ncbi:19867_t:CDS:2 [Rhizophagus irregularis]|nr:19867_t:CDS:2 [Rhizophagus irregularis]